MSDRLIGITPALHKRIVKQLEARRDGFKAAYPAQVILDEIAEVERILEALRVCTP